MHKNCNFKLIYPLKWISFASGVVDFESFSMWLVCDCWRICCRRLFTFSYIFEESITLLLELSSQLTASGVVLLI